MRKTRFILAGGNDRSTKSYWQDLAKVVGHSEQLHVLSCMFARPPEVWQETYQEFDSFFKIAFGDDMASELADPGTFETQLQKADVVYLHGGDTKTLKSHLAKIDNLEAKFNGKIIIGSSAGAQILSKKYWSCGNRKLGDGFGLTPLNTVVHYGSEFGSDDPRGPINWSRAEKELQQVIGDAQVTLLPEGKFVVCESEG